MSEIPEQIASEKVVSLLLAIDNDLIRHNNAAWRRFRNLVTEHLEIDMTLLELSANLQKDE